MIQAIDVHSHVNHGSQNDAEESAIYKADLDTLQTINRNAGIKTMLCSTFASVLSTEQVEEENEYMFELARKTEGLYQWVVIDPRNERTFEQAATMIHDPKCVGIKLHPPGHQYTLEEFGDKLFSFAASHHAIVQIHPETEADYILPFANAYPDVTFIMSHLGSYGGTTYADAIVRAKYGNVYTDTSGIASSKNMVIEYTVGRVGSERILFGTDTYAAGFHKGRIEYALIKDTDKENILWRNAQRLFGKAL